MKVTSLDTVRGSQEDKVDSPDSTLKGIAKAWDSVTALISGRRVGLMPLTWQVQESGLTHLA